MKPLKKNNRHAGSGIFHIYGKFQAISRNWPSFIAISHAVIELFQFQNCHFSIVFLSKNSFCDVITTQLFNDFFLNLSMRTSFYAIRVLSVVGV